MSSGCTGDTSQFFILQSVLPKGVFTHMLDHFIVPPREWRDSTQRHEMKCLVNARFKNLAFRNPMSSVGNIVGRCTVNSKLQSHGMGFCDGCSFGWTTCKSRCRRGVLPRPGPDFWELMLQVWGVFWCFCCITIILWRNFGTSKAVALLSQQSAKELVRDSQAWFISMCSSETWKLVESSVLLIYHCIWSNQCDMSFEECLFTEPYCRSCPCGMMFTVWRLW